MAATVAALLALLTGACGSGGNEGPRTILVDMRYSKFEPSAITVRAGETVRFDLRNHDPIPHEFVLGDEETQQRHEREPDRTHDGHPGQASLAAGETDAVTFTFASAGTLIFGCHRPGHYEYGMRGLVRVA